MALVVLQRSFDDGNVLHPAGVTVSLPDELLASLLKGELDMSSNFFSRIKKKAPAKRGPKPGKKKAA